MSTPSKRKQAEALGDDADATCIICSDAPADMKQAECGHALLCVDCAFRVFSQDRRCPSYQTAMLLPLAKRTTRRELTPELLKDGFEYAAKAAQVRSKSDGVKQALKGLLPLLPPSAVEEWCEARDALNGSPSGSLPAYPELISAAIEHPRLLEASVAVLYLRSNSTEMARDLLQSDLPFLKKHAASAQRLLQTLAEHAMAMGPLYDAVNLADMMDVTAVVTSMRAFPGVAPAQSLGCELLRNYLCEYIDSDDDEEEDEAGQTPAQRRASLAAAAGAIGALAAAVQLCPANAALRGHALGALAHIAEHTALREDLLQNPEILRAVLSAMEAAGRSGGGGVDAEQEEAEERAQTLSDGCRAIGFAFDSEYFDIIMWVPTGAPSTAALLAALKALRCPDPAEIGLHARALKAIQDVLSYVLMETAMAPPVGVPHGSAMIEWAMVNKLGAEAAREAARRLAEWLVEAGSNHHAFCESEAAPLCERACFALKWLSACAPARAAALEADVISGLCCVLEKHFDSKPVVLSAVVGLSRLLRAEKAKGVSEPGEQEKQCVAAALARAGGSRRVLFALTGIALDPKDEAKYLPRLDRALQEIERPIREEKQRASQLNELRLAERQQGGGGDRARGGASSSAAAAACAAAGQAGHLSGSPASAAVLGDSLLGSSSFSLLRSGASLLFRAGSGAALLPGRFVRGAASWVLAKRNRAQQNAGAAGQAAGSGAGRLAGIVGGGGSQRRRGRAKTTRAAPGAARRTRAAAAAACRRAQQGEQPAADTSGTTPASCSAGRR